MSSPRAESISAHSFSLDTSQTPTPKPQHTMPKSSYIPFNDDAFAAQLQAFKNAIAAYGTTLGLTRPRLPPRQPTPITTVTSWPASS
jgi:hypothetical protein